MTAQSFIRKPVCKVKLFACCLVNYYFLGRVLTTVFMMMHKTNRYPASPVLSSCTLSAVFILAQKLAVVLIFFFNNKSNRRQRGDKYWNYEDAAAVK